jgi:DNA-binding NtrC family response regulator
MNEEQFGILIVDDEPSVRDSLYHWFRKDGFRVAAAENAHVALERFKTDDWDLALLDIKMPGMDGMELQRRLRQVAPNTTVVMITAHGTIETAVEALKCGAFDYVTKPVDPDDLTRVVWKALEHKRIKTENVRLRAKIDELGEDHEIVGESPEIQQVIELVKTLAQNDVSVLIRGESGTGKELVARAIHTGSPRRYFPLVPVNCGAVPEPLLESELFGHERGAFTGAAHRRQGRLEQADGGTLFLDEIGSISPRMQVELLRVLDTKEFTRIGGNRAIHVDFRVVCATNQDLEQLIQDKLFREDLYFRINVFPIELPPLRKRASDIPLLARHFLADCATRLDKQIHDFSDGALNKLLDYDWPGNVRELANTVERAVVVADGPVLQVDDLPLMAPAGSIAARDDALAEMERVHVARVLAKTEWNISQAAKLLQVDRTTLYKKIKKYDLKK